MRFAHWTLIALLLVAPCSIADQKSDRDQPARRETNFDFVSSEDFLAYTLDDLSEANVVGLERFRDTERGAVLPRIAKLPKLETLRFVAGDLTQFDEHEPVSGVTTTVLIEDGKISQGTMRWLAKYPAGVTVLVAGLDLRGLELDLGKFKWVTIDDCMLSRAQVFHLLENSTQVTFKNCTISEERETGT